jgi:opacity protein-like surface antigen
LNVFGNTDFAGDWSYTVPDTAGPHASMRGLAKATALMINGYRDFDLGTSTMPFLTAGVGLARTSMSGWTRINPDSDRAKRTFEGGNSTGLAWFVGFGVAMDVGPVLGAKSAKLEFAYRYFDLGSVQGGVSALPGSGAGGDAIQGLNFDMTDQVLSIGLRIPLGG